VVSPRRVSPSGESASQPFLTGIVAGFAAFQLRSIKRTSRADFTKRFIDSFFVEDSRTLFTLLLNSALEFAVRQIKVGGDKIDELPYMRIKKEIAEQLTGIVLFDSERSGYSAFEVDDFFLGHFEDVGWYVKWIFYSEPLPAARNPLILLRRV
jgi:hypothetical protein